MAYSKLRGARKPKKKDENTLNISEHDAFQEQGMKIVDKVLAHPYFILGSVAAVLITVFVAILISSSLKSNSDKLAYEYSSAVQIFDSESGESTEFKDETEKYNKAIESFQKIISSQPGSFNAASSMVYVGKAYQAMKDCDKAVEFFNKAKNSGKLAEDLLFGTYEGEALCLFDKGEFEKAAGIWKEWLNVKTDIYKDYALYYIGLSYEKSGKNEESLSYYKRLRDEYSKSALVAKIVDKLPSENKPVPEPVEK